jgi:hypothetical protein
VNTNSTHENQRLASSLGLAVEGSESHIRAFFEELLIGPLYVPHRLQHYPLTNQPTYPNEFMSILGIQDIERVVVPCFTNPEHIVEWCGNALSYRSYTGSQLLELIPSDWWLVVGLGQDSSKELSPWELDTLKAGNEGISAIVHEHSLEELESASTLDVQALSESQLPKFMPKLVQFFDSNNAIAEIYIGTINNQSERDRSGDNRCQQYVIGLTIPNRSFAEHQTLRDECGSYLHHTAIGDAGIRIVTGESVRTSLSLSLFIHHQPILSRPL